LSDFVADYTCETPSNAAQYFGQIADRFISRVERARTRIAHGARIAVGNWAQRFDHARDALKGSMEVHIRDREQLVARLEKRLDAATPQRRLTERCERLTRLEFAFRQAGTAAMRDARRRFELLHERFKAIDPEAPLLRGYAIVTFEGRAVRDASSVPDGARIVAKVQRGRLEARVEKKVLDG